MISEQWGIKAIYDCGGYLRDYFMGIPSKDRDFIVEGETYVSLVAWLESEGAKIFVPEPKHFTCRAKLPQDHWLHDHRSDTYDFALFRKDGPTLDGRRPTHVEHAATLEEDLARRDFTVNAMAIRVGSDVLIDPFGGLNDLQNRIIRFVGDPMVRIAEDGLRILRAYRFMITKGMTFAPETEEALRSVEAAAMLGPDSGVSPDRVLNELKPMFKFNRNATAQLLQDMPDHLYEAIFPQNGPLWLKPTLESP